MGLYKERISISEILKNKTTKYLILGVLVVIILIVAGTLLSPFINSLFQRSAIEAGFLESRIKLNDKDYTTLVVTITNITEAKGENVRVTVSPVAAGSLLIDSKETNTKTIDVIGMGEQRRLEFLIRANQNKDVLQGNYQINVETEINSQKYEKQLVLAVE